MQRTSPREHSGIPLAEEYLVEYTLSEPRRWSYSFSSAGQIATSGLAPPTQSYQRHERLLQHNNVTTLIPVRMQQHKTSHHPHYILLTVIPQRPFTAGTMFSTTLALTTLTIHTALALSPSCAPGGNFDLTKRTLQLPTGTTNNPDQIPSSRLQGCNGYQDPGHNYFFTESGDGALVMKVPGDPPNTNCVTTSGSKHCRTECRESSPSSWSTTASKNRMYVDLIGVSGSQVCVGQAFQADSGYSKPVAEIYYYDNGDIKVGVEKVKAGGSQMLYQVGNVQQGKRWRYELRYEGGKSGIAVNGGAVQNLGLFFETGRAYFKMGNYNHGSRESDLHVFGLSVVHA